MCGAFVCSGNFRHGDRKNRWCDIVTSFYWILVWMVRSALKAHAASAEAEDPSGEYKIYPAWKCALYIVGGAVAIKFGGDFVVDGASAIAVKAGLSQNLIGLTIVAMGTSLPEFVTSVVAARKMKLIWHLEM